MENSRSIFFEMFADEQHVWCAVCECASAKGEWFEKSYRVQCPVCKTGSIQDAYPGSLFVGGVRHAVHDTASKPLFTVRHPAVARQSKRKA